MSISHRPNLALALLAAGLLAACASDQALSVEPDPAARPRLLIIGQDLGAIRGYMASDCCPEPDALTAYVGFYNISNLHSFGGLGMGG